MLLLVGVALLGSSCGGDDDDATTTTTSSTTTTRRTTSSTAVLPIELGPARALGDGALVGVHPSEPIAYLSIIDHDSKEVGCEGGDVARLWAQPIAGGDPVRALPDSFLSGIVLTGGSDGRVAVVDSCEGFLSSLTVATPDSQGRFGKVATIDTSDAESDGQLQPGTLRWSADGSSFLGIVHLNDSIERTIGVRISLDGIVQQLVEGDGLLAVADLKDGSIVTATATHVTVGGASPVDIDRKVTSIAVSPDGTSIAVFGDDGVEVIAPAEGTGTNHVNADVSSVGSWSPPGDQLAYLAITGDTAGVRVSRLGGAPEIVTPNGGFGAPLFTADGRFVVYNDAVASGQGFDEPRAMARAVDS